MKHLNITAKIWLSIGVFILGYVLATVLGQVQGLTTEARLQSTGAALFPAAQSAQEAEAAFQRMSTAFSNAVLLQDACALEGAGKEGQTVVASLRTISTIRGIDPARAHQTSELGASVESFSTEAQQLYSQLLANPSKLSELRDRAASLATTTSTLKQSLAKTREDLASDLRVELQKLVSGSASQRRIALAVFAGTLLAAAFIVNLTIRRAITGPIGRVIEGMRQSADGASEASGQMNRSGAVVARDAQQQAAYLQETTASLAHISATTRTNAGQASQADHLMREATQSVLQAMSSMNDLAQSMDTIQRSSKQVVGVLKNLDNIAFQTNILALNAAVEAARAGAAGSGFSVVADEVRSLAKKSTDSARQSADIVEKTIADVANGVALVARAHDAFSAVSSTIRNGSEMVSRIAENSTEQAKGITRIGDALGKIEKVTQSNASNAQQTAVSASQMTSQIESTRRHLEDLVSVVGVR